MYRREGGKTGPVCQFVYVSQQCRGCWGGRCWSFSSRPAKLPRARRKEGGEYGGWFWVQVEGGGGRAPIPELSWVPTSPVASCSQRGRDKRGKGREWVGLWPSRGSRELNKGVSKSRCGVHGFDYSGRYQILGCKAAAGLGVVEVEVQRCEVRGIGRGVPSARLYLD